MKVSPIHEEEIETQKEKKEIFRVTKLLSNGLGSQPQDLFTPTSGLQFFTLDYLVKIVGQASHFWK